MTKTSWLLSLLITFLTTALVAQEATSKKKLAVLEFTNEAKAKNPDAEALADDVRQAALVVRKQYTIMTRESMLVMLPPGTDLSACADGQCEVEAGRKVGADMIASGILTRFSGQLEVRLKLFDTINGELLAQESAQGADLIKLREALREAAKRLFASLLPPAPPVPELVVNPSPTPVPLPAPVIVKTTVSGWISIRVPTRKPDGRGWDAATGAPDIVGRLVLGGQPMAVPKLQDSFIARIEFEGVRLAPGDRISWDLVDKDIAANDRIGTGSFYWDGSESGVLTVSGFRVEWRIK